VLFRVALVDQEHIEIVKLSEQDHALWDTYVDRHEQGSFFHLSGWASVLAEGLGHRAYYYFARSEGRIVAVLPLAHVKSFLFGNALVSTPFCVFGGVLADNSQAAIALEHHARQLAQSLGVDYLEFRGQCHDKEGILQKDLYVNFRKAISADNAANLSDIPRKQRAVVRKGINSHLYSEWDDTDQRFFRAYSESVRNLGPPIFPRRYFRVLQRVFGDAVSILTISVDQSLVASVLSFRYKDCILPYYGGGVEKARALKGNDFMYWELMRRSADQGITCFDYGRSKKGTGSYSFKKNWGFEAAELPYYYFLVRAKEIPDLNPLNPKYRFFIAAWKKLPLAIANFIGPFLARYLG